MKDELIDITSWAKGIVYVEADNIQDMIITISTVIVDQHKQIAELKEEGKLLKEQLVLLSQIVGTQEKSIQVPAHQ